MSGSPHIRPEHLCTLVYTSGTTGRPKGVRLPHSVWTYEGAAVEGIRVLSPDDLQLLWLPLSHVFGQVLLAVQFQIGFATAIDGRVDKIVANAAAVQPTFMAAAPRVFEKAHGRIVTMMEAEGGVKAKLFHWAFGIGSQVSAFRQQGKSRQAYWPRSTPSPTSSCCRRSGTASAGRSASSSPVRRHWTRSSPNGSTRPDC